MITLYSVRGTGLPISPIEFDRVTDKSAFRRVGNRDVRCALTSEYEKLYSTRAEAVKAQHAALIRKVEHAAQSLRNAERFLTEFVSSEGL